MPVTYLRKVKANELDRVIEIIEEAKTFCADAGLIFGKMVILINKL